MKKIAMMSVAVLTMLAQIAWASPEQTYGRWGIQFSQEGFTLSMVLNIGAEQSTVSNTCSYQGRTVTASVTVPTRITDSTIEILGEGTDNKEVGGVNCSVSLQRQVLGYTVTPSTLTLTRDDDEITFNRLP